MCTSGDYAFHYKLVYHFSETPFKLKSRKISFVHRIIRGLDLDQKKQQGGTLDVHM